MGKKIYALLCGLALMAAFSSCNGSNNDNKSADAMHQQSEASNDVVENKESASAGYKVIDGKIVSESERPLVVDFYADWCPPCRQMKPIFHSLAEKYAGEVDFVSINVDENKELAQVYGVQGIPYFVFLAPDGKQLGDITGAVPESDFIKALASYFDLK